MSMTSTDYKLMEHLAEAFGELIEAAKIAHLGKYPEAPAISKLIDSLEDITSDAWDRFRTEEKQLVQNEDIN